MVSKEEIRSKIVACEYDIAECRKKIRNAEVTANKVMQMRRKIVVFFNMFDEAHVIQRNRLNEVIGTLSNEKRYSNNVLKNYEDGTKEALEGKEYKDAKHGLELAMEVLSGETQRLNRMIVDFENYVHSVKRKVLRYEEQLEEMKRQEALGMMQE